MSPEMPTQAPGFPSSARLEGRPGGRRFASVRAISAMILREMSTRYGRTPGGYLWAFLQPLGIIIILGFAFSLIARSPSLGTSFILFKATGILPFQMAKNNANQIGRSVMRSRSLLEYPGVTWVDAILSTFLLTFLVSLIVMVVLLTGIVIVEDVTLILDWAPIALSIGLAAFTALSWGALNAYLFARIDVWSNVWMILNAPLMIASGVLIMYEDLPLFAQRILWYNPFMHITGLMREGIYSTYEPQYISVAYVLVCAFVPLVLGLLLLRRYHRSILER